MNGSIVILVIASVTASMAAALAIIGTTATIVLPALAQTATNTTTAQGDNATSLATRIQITKYATNSYTISEGSSRIGSFDTIYTITGSVDDISGNSDLITSTIQSDFNASSTIGYVMTQAASNDTQATSPATLPNPFATGEEVNQRIADEIQKGIEAAERSDEMYAEIMCHFGMDLPAFECRFVPLIDQVQ